MLHQTKYNSVKLYVTALIFKGLSMILLAKIRNKYGTTK